MPTIGPRPLDVFLKAMPYRLFMGVIFIVCVWWASIVRGPSQEFFPIYFYVTILLVYAVHQVKIIIINLLLYKFKFGTVSHRLSFSYVRFMARCKEFMGAYHLTEKSGWGVKSIMVSNLPVYRRNATSITV